MVIKQLAVGAGSTCRALPAISLGQILRPHINWNQYDLKTRLNACPHSELTIPTNAGATDGRRRLSGHQTDGRSRGSR